MGASRCLGTIALALSAGMRVVPVSSSSPLDPYTSQWHPLSRYKSSFSLDQEQRTESSTLFKGRARISPDPAEFHTDGGGDYDDFSEGILRIQNTLHHEHRMQPINNLNLFPHSIPSNAAHRGTPNVIPPNKDEIRLAFQPQHQLDPKQQEGNQDHPMKINDQKHKYLKTGTTIVGVQTRNQVILAADTRATEGSVVADTRCEKVHQLARNVWCCGAGTSADLDALTRKVRYTFLLKSMIRDSVGNGGFSSSSTTSPAPVSPHPPAVGKLGGDFTRSEEEMDINSSLCDVSIASICNMIREDLIRGGGQIGANLVLGGVDPYTKHPVLTAIHPHGSMDVVPFTALGSGGLAAMGVLEACFKVDMTLEEGIELVKSAVVAGIKNDLGSGSQVRSSF